MQGQGRNAGSLRGSARPMACQPPPHASTTRHSVTFRGKNLYGLSLATLRCPLQV